MVYPLTPNQTYSMFQVLKKTPPTTPNKKDTMTHTMQTTTLATYAAKHAVALAAYTEALAAFNAAAFTLAPYATEPLWDTLTTTRLEFQIALKNKLWAEGR